MTLKQLEALAAKREKARERVEEITLDMRDAALQARKEEIPHIRIAEAYGITGQGLYEVMRRK